MKRKWFYVILSLMTMPIYALPAYSELDSKMRDWINNNPKEIIEYCGEVGHPFKEMSLEALDYYYNNLVDTVLEKGNEQFRIIWGNAIGFTFGDIIAKKFGLEWAIIEDEYGKDYVLVDKEAGLIINAVGFINKRIYQDNKHFILTDGTTYIYEIARMLKK
jgi:tRNA(Ile)-lysidine synthase TilS/MesJ